MGTQEKGWSDKHKNASKQLNAGGVQFVEDLGLVNNTMGPSLLPA